MDGTEISNSALLTENTESSNNVDTEHFQMFMYELFDKNGIINDLRAYLRKHIVDLLKSSQKGEVPSCQKHFTQRLELPSQAINILLVEYFLRMEFSYTLSVFVSEIPLSNMMFDFAKNLMQNKSEDTTKALRFNDKDVWAILNFLGIKCDSEYACSVLEMYKTEKHKSLLLCIINCMNTYRQEQCLEPECMSDGSATVILSEKSCNSIEGDPSKKRQVEKCHHYLMCKVCRGKILRMKDKYGNKSKIYAKRQASITSKNGERIMKNMKLMEREVLNETFNLVSNVHEAEVDQVRNEEEQKVKRSLANQALQLHKRKMQLEESFNKRAARLESNMAAKKRFLWGLASTLRDQHKRLARAMLAVTNETKHIADKEHILKRQIGEAEEILHKRDDDLHLKISREMLELEAHVDNLKRERSHLHKERIELEEMKKLYADNTVIKIHNLEEKIHDNTKKIHDYNEKNIGNNEKICNEDLKDLKSRYDVLNNEISKLKRYIQAYKPIKSMIERSTATDQSDTSSKSILNNEQEERHLREDVKPPNQVVNDFKKQKNVNFDQLRIKIGEDHRARSPSLSEAGDFAASPGRSADPIQKSPHHSPDRSSVHKPAHSPGHSPAHSPGHSSTRGSSRSRSPSPLTVVKSTRDCVRRKQRLRQVQIKVGGILEDRRYRSPTANDTAGVCVAHQSVASHTGHNQIQNPGHNRVQSCNLSPHRQCEAIVSKTLEEKEILKARARLQLHLKVGEMCNEHRRQSLASVAGDITIQSPDKGRSRSPENASIRCPGNATSRSRSHSPPTEMPLEVSTLKKLLEENERLKCQARQQEEQINSLTSQQARLAAQLLSMRSVTVPLGSPKPKVEPMGPMRPIGLMGPTRPPEAMRPMGVMRPLQQQLRPRTAPAALPVSNTHVLEVNPIASASSMGWRKGAGEDLSWFPAPQRILVPGDVLPFIGVLTDRHDANAKRHSLPTYRKARRVHSPHGHRVGGGSSPRAHTTPPTRHKSPQPESETTTNSSKHETPNSDQNEIPSVSCNVHERDKSPKSVLREAKLKLKTKEEIKAPIIPREKSPTAVLREAKMRLRKLEIEAEAVEKSYLDFRKRQTELKNAFDISMKRNKPQEIDTKYPKPSDRNTEGKHSLLETKDKTVSNEVGAFKGYSNNLDLNDIRFRNRITVSSRIKPVPVADSNQPTEDRLKPNNDYIEKPMTEFRKLYMDTRPSSGDGSRSTVVHRPTKGTTSPQSSRSPQRQPSYGTNKQTETPLPLEVVELQVKKEALMKEKEEKIAELEILKDNINKIYNLESRKSPSGQQTSENSGIEEKGNYRPDVGKSGHNAEEKYEVNKVIESSPLSVHGQDSGNTSDIHPDAEREQISPKMTIIISPKRSPTDVRSAEKRRSVSPEQAARLTRNDVLDAIFHTDALKDASSYDMETESKDDQDTITDEEQGPPEDYLDDFSADVDDFNAVSDYGNSPISLAKPVDDENFWDS
ncbi:uncharacterized protein LOC113238006 [Hyposmocoma kahamanoa]|uniref:uncharacterized protein LOC113238006 n=1 Tax=Hyposmocoma kahamanoa TaxID=1477025 RepID=UPI000E6D97EE|nr:uncharacterized protein LOC113238006 [Hyposmocoma kahamanoa]